MSSTQSALVTAAVVSAAVALLGPILRSVLRRRGHPTVADDLGELRWPTRLLAASLFARFAVDGVEHDGSAEALTGAMSIVALTWGAMRGLVVVQRALLRRLRIDEPDNRRARARVTQIELVRSILNVVVVFAGLLVLVLTLTPIARFGPTIVAYAGVIGVVLGLALRTPLENLVAGLQVAITEPIRLDDVVVVEEEWGRIEQIGLVNVAVRLWDDRRLVLPTAYFVSTPFENWTRDSANVTATILLWVDHCADLEVLRREYTRLVEGSPLWDRRVCELQVVELGERGVKVRGLASARNAGDSWNLACDVRESLVPVLRADERWLPRVRGWVGADAMR